MRSIYHYVTPTTPPNTNHTPHTQLLDPALILIWNYRRRLKKRMCHFLPTPCTCAVGPDYSSTDQIGRGGGGVGALCLRMTFHQSFSVVVHSSVQDQAGGIGRYATATRPRLEVTTLHCGQGAVVACATYSSDDRSNK